MVARGVRDLSYWEVPDSLRREKLGVRFGCPYRKPTQVDEERILRPARERLLRNSAK